MRLVQLGRNGPELQQVKARMGIEMPLTGSPIRLPSVERVDELRQRVAPIRPRRVILSSGGS
jgi:hypothetical protein